MREAARLSDEDLLDRFERGAFGYFLRHANPRNGLVPDSSRADDPASIAAVGFALSCYPVGVERGWMTREQAIGLTLAALRFFSGARETGEPDSMGFRGFYYHFLDMKTGARAWRSEVSVIDTTLLIAGVLLAGVYFDRATPGETEIRARAEALYARVDWRWACDGNSTVHQGWTPEGGFIHYGWNGYDEAAILYVLGLASPTHRLPRGAFDAWTMSYQWENIYGYDYLYAGPLFIHHFSHAWIDFRDVRDAFMREKDCDYFENSRRAVYVEREYARRNPHGFAGYGGDCWSLSACQGYGFKTLKIDSVLRAFLGYSARGAPYGPDDGTIAPCAALASLPFTPELALRALRHFCAHYPEIVNDDSLASGFNPTLPGDGAAGWVSPGRLGLDQGIVVMMIENYRSGLIWRLMRRCPHIGAGLRRAGFAGGWLS